MWHVHCQVIPLTRAATRASIWKKCQSTRLDMACWLSCFDGVCNYPALSCFKTVSQSRLKTKLNYGEKLRVSVWQAFLRTVICCCVMPNDLARQDYKLSRLFLPVFFFTPPSLLKHEELYVISNSLDWVTIQFGGISFTFLFALIAQSTVIWLHNFWDTHLECTNAYKRLQLFESDLLMQELGFAPQDNELQKKNGRCTPLAFTM